MPVTIAEAKKIMGKEANKYNDSQLEEIINLLSVLADMAIDTLVNKKQKPVIPEQILLTPKI